MMEQMEQIDLEELRKVNPEVIGWIRIPDTEIDYPVMQGTDNEFYLNHTWDGTENSVGSIFMEHTNYSGLTDYNTLIYGHNMQNGSMFAALRRYYEQEFYEAHPYVYVRNDQGVFRYEIFSAYPAAVDSSVYRVNFGSLSDREAFLAEALDNSSILTGVEPGVRDRILTLSTCTSSGYSKRWVVQARLKMVQTEY